MDHEGSLPGRRGQWLLAALVLGGIAGNGFGLPVLAHGEFRVGSLFTLLVLQLFGAVPAVAAALIGSLPLWLPGGHPEAAVWLTAEAAFLGWFLRRRRTGLVQADLLFWILAGMPLAFGWLLLALKAAPSAAELGAAHAMVNGLANALVARLVFLAWATVFRGERVPAQEAVFDLLAAFVVVPALVLTGLGGRSGFRPMDPRQVLLPVPLVLAVALGAAQLVSRRCTLALRRFGTLARELVPRLASGQPPEPWPESSLQETSEVVDQFRAATDHLARQFRQIRQSGEQFEQKVAERTRELRESERKFRMMMENAYDWERWDSPGGDILYSTPSCERITGLPAECFERDPGALRRLIHPVDYPRWKAHYAAFHSPLAAGGPAPGPSCETDLRILRPDGTVRWVEHTCHPLFDSLGTYQGRRVKVRDLTDWKLAEQAREHSAALERFSKTQKAIIECNQAIIRAKDEDDLLRDFCRISMKVHGVHQVWVGLIGPGGIESMWLAAAIGFQPGSWSRAWARPRLARKGDPFGQTAAEVAIRTRQPCIQGNPAPGQDPGDAPLGHGPDSPVPGQGPGRADGPDPGAGTRSTIALPLLSGQKVLGALVLNSVNPENFAEEPGQMLLELANNLAIGIVDLWTRAERDRALLTAERQAEQLRFLAMELTQAEQRERKRLGQLLHDHLQQLLVGATFSVETVNGQVETRVARKTLVKLTETLQEAIQVSRRLAVELSPPVVREKRLGACLEWLRLEFARNHGLKVALDLAGKVDPDPEPVRMFVFEAVRELLLNVVKHAKVDHALLKLRVLDGQRLEITVADHGAGFDPELLEAGAFPADGLGLFSLRQRLRFLKGSLEIKSSPGGGSSFTMIVPAQGWPEERKGFK